ncbi:MAG: SHOCT domain-containing protein [Actinobacteria bacterium]|nr:SHOCT domain-containing protein [Actinomycetota bacterium]MCB9412780.1 SHOCT domain-containing protein [Actinomycetota bacterium]
MGLLRMAARTAVVAGTATAVSGRVANRQANKFASQQAAQQQAAQQQYAQQQPAAPQQPAAVPDEATVQLQNLANLHSQGILTDAEFAAAKAKILGI